MRLLVLYPRLLPTRVPPHYIRHLAEDFPRCGGHIVYGPGRPDYVSGKPILDVLEELGPFDGLLALEQKYNRWAIGIQEVELPKAILLTDYVEFKNQVEQANGLLDTCQFDLLFYHTAIEGVNLERSGRRERAVFVPFGVDTAHFRDWGQDRPVDACAMWCENKAAYPERSLIKELLNHSGLQVFTVHAIGADYVRVLNSSKICVSNGTIYKNMQSRFMEATACGCLLLTDWVTELDACGFVNGQHLVLYSSPEDCIEKVRWYVANDPERRRIAANGMEFTAKWFSNDVLIGKIQAEMLKLIGIKR